jgi:REP element-mobilizing transposase RayT
MTSPTPLLANHYYHIYNRGNNGGDVFLEQRNYQHFLKLYTQYIFPIAKTYAYCLMKNHFHFLVSMRPAVLDLSNLEDKNLSGFGNPKGLDIPNTSHLDLSGLTNPKGLDAAEINYSQHFGNLFNAYTKAINKAYQRTGSLFEKPFHKRLVDSDSYLIQLVSYIHRNPQHHGVVDDFRTYPYSSYLAIHSQKHSKVETQTTLSWFANVSSFEAYHLQFNELAIKHLMMDDA